MSWFSKYFFMMILIFSSLMGMLMTSNLLIWSFMEINMLAFVPMISLEKKINSHLMGMKYFLIQALGSIFLLVSIIFMMIFMFNPIFNFFMILSLLLKSGTPPFQFWFFSLSLDLDWFMFFMLSSWQKILPFYIISKIYFFSWEWVIFLTLIISIGGSFYQSSIKKLMVYSSIFMTSWILSSMALFHFIWFLLLFIYSCLMLLFIMFMLMEKMSLKESQSYYMSSSLNKNFQFLILLSMGGIPPLSGFFMKISILLILIQMNLYMLMMMLIMSSVVILYMYLLMFLNSLSMGNSRNKMMINIFNFNYMLSMFILILLGLMVFIFINL